MTQNTTNDNKQEQCDKKHNALKIYLAEENIYRIPLLQPTCQQLYSTHSLSSLSWFFYYFVCHNLVSLFVACIKPLLFYLPINFWFAFYHRLSEYVFFVPHLY